MEAFLKINLFCLLLDRKRPLLENYIHKYHSKISSVIISIFFLVIGSAGLIGQAVTNDLFILNPKKLHILDINENNLFELVSGIHVYTATLRVFSRFLLLIAESSGFDEMLKENYYMIMSKFIST